MRTNSGLPASTVESRRRLLLVTGALFLALTVWTILVAATPVVGFGVAWPRTRLSPESIGIVVHVLVAILIYLRYEVTGSPRLFVISLAFVGLAFSQFVLGASVGQIGGPVSPEAVYLWTAGRIVSACLLLAGAFVVRPDRSPSDGSGPRFFWAAAAVVVGLGAIDVVIWAARHRLPPLSSAVPAQISRAVAVLPGLTPADLIMGSVGAALYFAAALAYLRPTAPAIREVGWLAPALVIAGFGHLHYMLFPAILTDRLSTGDLLRLAFSASLLAGAAWEVRRSVQTERERATELERLYGAEKARVQELEAADRTRAELFSVLTHELAHPVAAIRGFAMTLSTRWRKLDDATRDRALQRMDHESKRLRDLAEEVVSVSRLDTPGFSLTTRP
ncbi:MAG TPA: histidine kinase dimerization/phospho-acceptor domain-containing protein, partial [Actinomycetota bacterium]